MTKVIVGDGQEAINGDVEIFALTHGNNADQASGEFGQNRNTKLMMLVASGRVLKGSKLQIDGW